VGSAGGNEVTENISQISQALSTAISASGDTSPLVYIHIRSQAQTAEANQIAAKLKSEGYSVPKAEILVDKGPKNTQVRYFQKSEEEENEAGKIADILKQFSLNNIQVIYIRHFQYLL
jgi:hypothetical protein